MRENDFSPDLNDLNTLRLEDYQTVLEKNGQQQLGLSSVGSSPKSSWNHFPPIDDFSPIPEYLMHQLIPSDSSSYFPDLGYIQDCSLLAGSPRNDAIEVNLLNENPPEALYSLPIFPQSRSLSTSPEIRTPGESGTDNGNRGLPTKNAKTKLPRHKRPSHINAEHRRRSKIQRCLEDLKTLVPHPLESGSSSSSSGKKSKASLLVRTAEYCRQLKADCRELQLEADALRTELQSLSAEINACHTELPADGIKGQVTSTVSLQQMFDNYVYARTVSNWKFWIFGLFIRPLFQSYESTVMTTNQDDFCRSLLKWLNDHCNLPMLRKVVHNAVFHVGRCTSVITTPENLPKEAMEAAIKEVGMSADQSRTLSADNGQRACLKMR